MDHVPRLQRVLPTAISADVVDWYHNKGMERSVDFVDLSLNDSPMMSCESEELEDEGDITMKVDDVGMKRKGRGPTMCHDVHALEDGKKIYVEWDDLGQPVGKGGKSLRTFLGIVARNADKCLINVQSWDKMPQNCIEDVWLFIQKEKIGTDPNRADVFIITHTKKDGRPINEDCAIAIEKFKTLKQTQPSTNSSNPVVAKDDAFSMVFGEEKSSRIRGVGTGPTPSSLWGRKNKMLKSENKTLHQRIKVLEEKFAKLENKELEEVLVDEAKRSLFSGKPKI
ncbi:hypothetical protein Taro_040519 [Colocasia esculenta]|uniref:Uncharacterized protein n=1 Tax=Colocasia esculenta TaxID=4460 RepID=A0A843WUS9_COLES|nr:hypothetical protein [Colocasia esculenta]